MPNPESLKKISTALKELYFQYSLRAAALPGSPAPLTEAQDRLGEPDLRDGYLALAQRLDQYIEVYGDRTDRISTPVLNGILQDYQALTRRDALYAERSQGGQPAAEDTVNPDARAQILRQFAVIQETGMLEPVAKPEAPSTGNSETELEAPPLWAEGSSEDLDAPPEPEKAPGAPSGEEKKEEPEELEMMPVPAYRTIRPADPEDPPKQENRPDAAPGNQENQNREPEEPDPVYVPVARTFFPEDKEPPVLSDEELEALDNGALPEDDELNRSFSLEDTAIAWWDGMQALLDQEGCELDLSAPEDALRIVMFDAVDEDNITAYYALDPAHRTVDVAAITMDEAVARQDVDDITVETILRMYEAAQNGTLYVRPHMHAANQLGPRQLLVGRNGEPAIGSDFMHPTDDERDLIHGDSKPAAPEPLPEEVEKAAAQGDPKAIRAKENYDDDQRLYQEDMALWNRAQELERNDPDWARRVRADALIQNSYFHRPFEEGISLIDYGKKVTRLHDDMMFARLPKAEQEIELHSRAQLEAMADLRVNTLVPMKRERNATLQTLFPREGLRPLAELFVRLRERERGEELRRDGRAGEFRPMTEQQLKDATQEMFLSEEFRRGTRNFTWGTVDSILYCESGEFTAKVDKLMDTVRQNALQPAPVPDFTVFRSKVKQLSEELHNANRFFSNNSPQYKDLRTGLEALTSTLDGIDGIMTPQQTDDLLAQIRSVNRLGIDYVRHVGLQGKNRRQQFRLEKTDELLAELSSLTHEDTFDDMVDAYHGVQTREVRNLEDIFQKGQTKTEALREELKELRSAGVLNREDMIRAEMSEIILNAREQLSDMVDSGSIDQEKARSLIASALAAGEVKRYFSDKNSASLLYQEKQKTFLDNPVIHQKLTNCDSQTIGQFLSGRGELELMQANRTQIAKTQNQRSAERRNSMVQQKSGPELPEPPKKEFRPRSNSF